MLTPHEPLSTSILVMMYFGEVVFAVSGALTAARYRMDIVGYAMVGTVTGIGGGTIRDLLLGRTVWWTEDPTELLLCLTASLATFFFIRHDISHRKEMIWADALGLSVFGVVGCYISLQQGTPFVIAVFMGMITATGGGVIRDVLTNNVPMIISCGQPYATVALLGSLCYATLRYLEVPEIPSEAIACGAAFTLRAYAILFDIQTGPPGEFLRFGKRPESNTNDGSEEQGS
ncbi:trimeric intracellular cation channel family protein [Blastopirellula marina]|uniref:Trimeric intracellular cation channel family protein n=1 Tax=Blastopirellula marina TaxID=124 RepID=A0A2S8F1L2_9BACT|nr:MULTISPECIES: trimeric intracellular cation channel family protein [Pirellulaceae]PQO26056.1 trimeric intracellular cation channel family protein [Blastopirellula marina]RCS44414.1 trimeric intracellular cation channel family protein [Bremerella cremea]